MFGRKERNTRFVREPLANLEDLRDDCVAIFRESGMTQQEVHAAGGPTPSTISKWIYRETMFPRLDTVRAFFRAVGHDLIPVPRAQADAWRKSHANVPRMSRKKR